MLSFACPLIHTHLLVSSWGEPKVQIQDFSERIGFEGQGERQRANRANTEFRQAVGTDTRVFRTQVSRQNLNALIELGCGDWSRD